MRRASLGQPPKVRSRRLKCLPHRSPQYRAAIEANGPVKTVCCVSNVPESVGSMSDRWSRSIRAVSPLPSTTSASRSGDSQSQRRMALYPHRDLRPYREWAVDLGHHNDVAWPLGGVRPHRPYILDARRGGDAPPNGLSPHPCRSSSLASHCRQALLPCPPRGVPLPGPALTGQ